VKLWGWLLPSPFLLAESEIIEKKLAGYSGGKQCSDDVLEIAYGISALPVA
jgi:hypothetical protein